MGFLKTLSVLIATKYGIVASGEYAGCKLVLGNDREKNVEVGGVQNQLVFVKGLKEIARVNATEIASYAEKQEKENVVDLTITWKNGKTTRIFVNGDIELVRKTLMLSQQV